MAVTISVIICTHNRPDSLKRCVRSVLAQSPSAAEIIVVNDGHDEIAGDIAAPAGVRLLLIRSRRASLAASRNLGIDAARADVLLLLDDDVVLPDGYLATLAGMYEADATGQVAVIGGVMVRAEPLRGTERIWRAAADMLASNRWGPRKCAGRYMRLAPAIRGRLSPARRLSGGAISVRRSAVSRRRFDDAFDGYSLGEDLDFGFHMTRRVGVFTAAELKVRHECSRAGRPDAAGRGRMYVANMIRIARNSTEADVGTWTLLTYHLVGMMLLAALWSALSLRRANLDMALGMARELWAAAVSAARKIVCAS